MVKGHAPRHEKVPGRPHVCIAMSCQDYFTTDETLQQHIKDKHSNASKGPAPKKDDYRVIKTYDADNKVLYLCCFVYCVYRSNLKSHVELDFLRSTLARPSFQLTTCCVAKPVIVCKHVLNVDVSELGMLVHVLRS